MGSNRTIDVPLPSTSQIGHEQFGGADDDSKTAPGPASATTGPEMWPPLLKWRRWGALYDTTTVLPSLATPLKGLPCDPTSLRERTAVVLGLGAVGGVVFSELANIGVGTVIGIDPDTYGDDSWLTQPCRPGDAGRWKAWVMGEAAHAVNPQARVLAAVGCAQDVPLSIFRRADVLIVAGDNLELLVWAGVLAGHLGLPLIQGAVHGETATCFVRSFDRSQPDGPCPGCLVGSAEWLRMKAKEGCDLKTLSLLGTESTRTLPTVCRTTAELVATEALMWLAGTTKGALRNQEMALSLYGHRVWCTKLSQRQNCRCPHDRWFLVDLDEPAEALCLSDLLARVERRDADDASADPQIRSEIPWITAAQCPKCGQASDVCRFARLGDSIGACLCGAPLVADRIGMSGYVIPKADLDKCLTKRLPDLGLKRGSAIGVSVGDEWTYFFVKGDLEANMVFESLPNP